MELNESDRLALSVAYLRSLGKSQKTIESELRISQPHVSRLLKHAERKGWFRREFRFRFPDELSDEEKEAIRCRGFPDREGLKRRLSELASARKGVPLKSLELVHLDHTSAERHAEFGRLVARYVAELIAPAKICAVAWGRTVLGVVEAIESVPPRPQLICAPAAGEPLNDSDSSSSCSLAAEQLANKFRCNSSPLSLRGVPARVPRDLAASARILKAYCNKSKAYRAIFAGPDALMNRADSLLTGVGDVASFEEGVWFQEIECMEGKDVGAVLEKHAAGNIGGVWLLKKDGSDARLRDINSRWLGMTGEHIKKCSLQAQRPNAKSPGVIVLAIEPSKAEIVHRTIGMVNHLVTTEALARKLASLTGS